MKLIVITAFLPLRLAIVLMSLTFRLVVWGLAGDQVGIDRIEVKSWLKYILTAK